MKERLLYFALVLIALQGYSQHYLIVSGDTMVVIPVANARNTIAMLYRYELAQKENIILNERIEWKDSIISQLGSIIISKNIQQGYMDSVNLAHRAIHKVNDRERKYLTGEVRKWKYASGGSAVLAFVWPPLALVPPTIVLITKKKNEKSIE